MGISVNREASTILKILLFVAIITCVPFIVVDLYLYHQEVQSTIDEHFNFKTTADTYCFFKNGGTDVSIKTWFAVDGYTKAVIVVLLILFNFISCCQQDSSGLLQGTGIILFIFYLFDFIWLILGIVIYTQEKVTIRDATFQITCPEEISAYIISALALGLLFTLINMIIVWLRPAEPQNNDEYNRPNPTAQNFGGYH